jgi:hypothetical protein
MVHELLQDIEAAIARMGIGEGTFGKLVGDREIVQQLRGGRWIRPSTVARIRLKMAHLEIARAQKRADAL